MHVCIGGFFWYSQPCTAYSIAWTNLHSAWVGCGTLRKSLNFPCLSAVKNKHKYKNKQTNNNPWESFLNRLMWLFEPLAWVVSKALQCLQRSPRGVSRWSGSRNLLPALCVFYSQASQCGNLYTRAFFLRWALPSAAPPKEHFFVVVVSSLC